MTDSRTIGIFDSGVGGLTVVKALKRRWPGANFLYLGDTARVPYGSKSPQVVERYAMNCARFLVERGATQLVIACNTASASALPKLQREFGLPIVGVIEPGAVLACQTSKTGRVGVIATEGTVASGSYVTAISALEPSFQVTSRACPLFVPLAEEGFADHPAARLIAQEYLCDFGDIDTLVLGCTHYPLLASLIRETVGTEIALIDSAEAVVEQITLPNESTNRRGTSRFFATDVSTRVQRVGSAFLGEDLPPIELVDL